MQTATKQLWAGVLAAIVGSLCCVAPLVFITLGIGGAWISQLTALEPKRPIFMGVMLVFIGLAFRQYVSHKKSPDLLGCIKKKLRKHWVMIMLLCPVVARWSG